MSTWTRLHPQWGCNYEDTATGMIRAYVIQRLNKKWAVVIMPNTGGGVFDTLESAKLSVELTDWSQHA